MKRGRTHKCSLFFDWASCMGGGVEEVGWGGGEERWAHLTQLTRAACEPCCGFLDYARGQGGWRNQEVMSVQEHASVCLLTYRCSDLGGWGVGLGGWGWNRSEKHTDIICSWLTSQRLTVFRKGSGANPSGNWVATFLPAELKGRCGSIAGVHVSCLLNIPDGKGQFNLESCSKNHWFNSCPWLSLAPRGPAVGGRRHQFMGKKKKKNKWGSMQPGQGV